MLGNIVYLHLFKLVEVLAVKQELDKNRFVKIIKEIPVKGGKENEQYMQYEAVSLIDNKVYTINNYLSPFNFTTIGDLEISLDYLEPMIETSRMADMRSIIDDIKAITKE